MKSQSGGVWWNKKSERDKLNLSPCEKFIKASYMYNYLLHAQKINSIDEIDNPTFRDYIGPIIGNLLDENINCSIYKNTLSNDYASLNEQRIRFNRVNPLTKEINCFQFRDKYIDVKIDEQNVYQTSDESAAKAMKTFLNVSEWTEIINSENVHFEYGQQFKNEFKKILMEHAMIPCVSMESFVKQLPIGYDEQLNKIEEIIYGNQQDFPDQLMYVDFMGDDVSCFEKKKAKSKNILNIAEPLSKLYWIDLYQINFKHSRIMNSGDVNRQTNKGYRITDNAIRVAEDENYFTDLMKSIYELAAGTSVPTVCPLDIFIMDGKLYCHDHKRIAANIMGGNRYMLGTLNQDAAIILRRMVGYHPERCVFSQGDKSMLLFFTQEQLKEWGHYFIVIGSKDQTQFMKTISRTTIEDRLKHLSKSGSYLLDYRYNIGPTREFSELHNPCYPSLFQSLDNVQYLVKHHINKINEAIEQIETVKHQIDQSPDQVGGHIMNNIDSTKFYEKYLIYKNRYIELKYELFNLDNRINKQIGGTKKFDQLITELNKHKNSLQEIDVELDNNDLNENSRETLISEKNDLNEKIKNVGIQLNELKKEKKAEKKRTKELKKEKVLKVPRLPGQPKFSSDLPQKKFKYAYTKKLFKNGLISVNQAEAIKSKGDSIQLMNEYLSYLNDQIIYLNNNKLTIQDLLLWELNNVGNSFGYLLHKRDIHFSIKNLILIKYPFIEDITSKKIVCEDKTMQNKQYIRYTKTDIKELEDLVLILRIAGDWDLGNKQTYSADELRNWQTMIDSGDGDSYKILEKFRYLSSTELVNAYPTTDGLIDEELLELIMANQKDDHQRIFAVERESGKEYGAYQGLHEQMIYSELRECPMEMTYSAHFTQPVIANKILAGKVIELKGQMLNRRRGGLPLPGWVALMGRYIHGFGWVEPIDGEDVNSGFTVMEEYWPYKKRLFNRFRGRVGIGVNMEILRNHYAEAGIEWADVCGINGINTIIYLKDIPPHALIAKDRDIVKNGDGTFTFNNAGTPITMEEFWKLRYDTIY
jgi:hypothetical protein